MQIKDLVNDYCNWLKNEISIEQFGDSYELTMPYLDRFNDYLQVYVKEEQDGKISITDGGYIISNLVSSGMKLRAGSEKRKRIDRIIRNNGLKNQNDSICALTSVKDFPLTNHMMALTMLAVDDLYEQGRKDTDFFAMDVASFCDNKEIFYTKEIKLQGITGSSYTYDFLFQRTKKRPDIFCKTINRLTDDKRNLTIFNWTDSQNERRDDSKLLVIFKDGGTRDQHSQIDAFRKYGIYASNFKRFEKDPNQILDSCQSSSTL